MPTLKPEENVSPHFGVTLHVAHVAGNVGSHLLWQGRGTGLLLTVAGLGHKVFTQNPGRGVVEKEKKTMGQSFDCGTLLC